jgi:predicted permease
LAHCQEEFETENRSLAHEAGFACEHTTTTPPIIALVQALGLLWLIVGIAYVLMWQDGKTLENMKPGLKTIINLSLPVVLFESLYTVNLQKVNYMLIAAITLAKFVMWCVGAATGFITGGGDPGVAGLYAMFLTLGNDIAFGVPLISALYPDLLAYNLFMCCISELVFNPMCYFLFEYAHHSKEGGEVSFRKIAANVFAEPMVVFAALGLFCNLIFNVALGACPKQQEHCPLPEFLDLVYNTIGRAFNLVALLSFGLHLYGNEHSIQGRAKLMPLGLTLLRVILLPTLTMILLDVMDVQV